MPGIAEECNSHPKVPQRDVGISPPPYDKIIDAVLVLTD